MGFNDVIERADISVLEQTKYINEIFQAAVEQSLVMKHGRRLPNLQASVTSMPVMDLMPVAYFTEGDTGLVQTSEVNWTNKNLNVRNMDVIVPIPKAVIADASMDLGEQVKPRIAEAFGKLFDGAVLFGTNAPAGWPTNIVSAATSAGQYVSLAASEDLYDALMREDTGVLAYLENDGYISTGAIAHTSMRGRFRNCRDADGNAIFKSVSGNGQTAYELDGTPCDFSRNGSFLSASALLVAGQWDQLVYALRQDITWSILDQAVIQDGAGNIVYNLAQQKMIGLMASIRLAWQLPNPVNALNSDSATRYPFSLLKA